MSVSGCCRFLAAVLAGLLTALGVASPAMSAGNASCLLCHADSAAKNAKGSSIAVDAAAMKASVHGEAQVGCTMCHADVADGKLPHADKLAPVACANCHAKAASEYAGTVHGKARAGGRMQAAACSDCHGNHDIRRPQDPASRTHHNNIEATCSGCHGNDEVIAKGMLPGGNIDRLYHDSIHGKALAGRGAARSMAPTCSNCHGAHDIVAKADPQSRVHRARIPDTCGGCHAQVREKYLSGQHGKLRQEGVTAAPGCNDCHGAHAVQSHDQKQFQLGVIEQCGKCHGAYIDTYRDTFHGKVTELGYVRVATCASCHGAHDVLPASDPLSSVSPANRLNTCRSCHRFAGASFAEWDPHADQHNKQRSFTYYYTARFMEVLLAGVFGFFSIHTVLWFYRSLRVRLARGNGRPTGPSESTGER
jgi:nitrate/TMAO reductase-like tetraheme cytochrome c subunit